MNNKPYEDSPLDLVLKNQEGQTVARVPAGSPLHRDIRRLAYEKKSARDISANDLIEFCGGQYPPKK